MRKLFFSMLFMSFTLFLTAQDYGIGAVPVKNGVVTFSEVVQVEGKTTEQLYSSVKAMIADVFKSAKDVIQSDDKDAGVLICKGHSIIKDGILKDKLNFTLKVACREGRYKIDLYNLSLVIAYDQPNPHEFDCNTTIIDEEALKNGKVKKFGNGKQRRLVIDEKNRIFSTIKEKIESNQQTEDEDW